MERDGTASQVGPSRRQVLAGLVVAGTASMVATGPAQPAGAAEPSGGPVAALPSCYFAGQGFLAADGVNLAADTLYAYRWMTEQRELAALGIDVLSSDGGDCSVQIAVLDDEEGQPGPTRATVTLDAQSAGVVMADLPQSLALDAGAFWLAAVAQGASANLRLHGHATFESDPEQALFGLTLPGSGLSALGIDGSIPDRPAFTEVAYVVPIVFVADAP